jgi:glycine/D-amino acid oxidase-like deaminating enzyme
VDVAIIGAGISGALVAHRLRNMDFSVTVVDRRHVGMGSTAASTSFLQYEIDTPLTRLCDYIGEKDAVKSYNLCREAIYALRDICKQIGKGSDFHMRPSLQYASHKSHVNDLYTEYSMRKKYGFSVKWLEAGDVKKTFEFEAPGAILSKDGGEVDAYLLTHHLLKAFHRSGHSVYNNTNIKHIKHHKRSVTLHADNGCSINARYVVIASGYESLQYIPKKLAEIRATYAMVSEPVDSNLLWHQNCLIWETARPYLYFRIADKDRVLIGGKDDAFYNPKLRDARIQQKATQLQTVFNKLMPQIYIKPDFSWAGAFAETKDGLPFIGSAAGIPHTYFALSFGGNGITFSVIAADIIHDLLLKKRSPNAHLFGFNR